MEKDLVNVDLGPEANFDLELVDGGLKASVVYSGSDVKGSLSVVLTPHLLLEKLKQVIPGPFDDIVLDTIFGK